MEKIQQNNKEYSQLFRFGELLRAGLWQHDPDYTVFSDAKTDWLLMYNWACGQALAALVLDGVNRLPAELRPERVLYLKWTHLVLRIEQSNFELDRKVAELSQLLTDNGHRFVLLKGQGIAREYAVPSHRQCGDIDFYTGGEAYREVNRILTSDGGVSDVDLGRFEKHRGFLWRGARIENHRMVVRFGTPWIRRRAKVWESKGMNTRCTVDIGGAQVLVPDPFFNAQYILIHAVLHLLSGGIGLRQVCDWAILLRNHSSAFNREEWLDSIRALGLEHSYRVFGSLAVGFLGLPESCLPMDCSPAKDEARRLLRDILEGGNFGKIRLQGRRATQKVWLRKLRSLCWMVGRFLKVHRFYPVEAEFRLLDLIGMGLGKLLGLHKI